MEEQVTVKNKKGARVVAGIGKILLILLAVINIALAVFSLGDLSKSSTQIGTIAGPIKKF